MPSPPIRRVLTGVLLVMIPILALPDPPPPPPRQVFMGGQYVYFPIHSMHMYMNGMKLNEWTRVRVRITGLGEEAPWEYSIRALGSAFNGDKPSNTLDLDFLRIQVALGTNNFDPANITLESTGPFEISASEQLLVSGNGNGEFVLIISYELVSEIDPDPDPDPDPASNNRLLGQTADYYSILLETILTAP